MPNKRKRSANPSHESINVRDFGTSRKRPPKNEFVTPKSKKSLKTKAHNGVGRPRKSNPVPNGSRASHQKKSWDFSDDENDEVESNATSETGKETTTLRSEFDEDECGSQSFSLIEQSVSCSDEILFLPWIELEESSIPPLTLPCSSSDLLIDGDHLFDALEVHEILRCFYRLIQLSPFLFEDFCSALRSVNQSNLLAEIHIALIRLLLRDDEEEQTIFVTPDTNASFNALIQFLEPMTYAEIIRQYAESDKDFPQDVLDVLRNKNYPFVDLDKRLIVIRWLCQRFFETAIIKRLLKNEDEAIQHDRNCRACGKMGDLLNCSSCEAAYHLSCIGLKKFPTEDWFCTICNSHKPIVDLNDESSASYSALRRQSPIGYDRHGRIYWFLARRLFVQDCVKNEIYYYSTLPQVHDLASELDPKYYEKQLCKKLAELMPTIAIQMHQTLELTDRRRTDLQNRTQREFPQPYLHVDNVHRMARIISKLQTEENVFEDEDDEAFLEDENGWTQESIGKQIRSLLCIEEERLAAPFWSGNMNENQLIEYYNNLKSFELNDENMTEFDPQQEFIVRCQRGFRLGFSDGAYRQYINAYSSNELSKPYNVRVKEKEKRKNLNARFGIFDGHEFSWVPLKQKDSSILLGSEADMLRCLQFTLKKLVEQIPDELMHRLWVLNGKKRQFLLALNNIAHIDTLKNILLLYERAIRKPVFSELWWNSLGHTRLQRIKAEDREKRQKSEQIKKRDEKSITTLDPAEEANIVWIKYTLTNGLPKHNVWKLRDEQFRVSSSGAFGGWMWISSTCTRNFSTPNKTPLNIRIGVRREALNSPEAKKAHKLERLIKRYYFWRILEEFKKVGKMHICYSSSCRFICSGTPIALRAICSQENTILPCYSQSCLRNKWDLYATKTNESVKCKNIFRQRMDEQKTNKKVAGEDIPFPFPRPYEFKSKSGRRSLLILPQIMLRRMARQGGLKADFLQGFSRTAKITSTWPYPCPKPLFDNTWRYMTMISTSYHAIALRFRQLYACVRWNDMAPDEDDDDPRIWSHHADYDEVRTVVGHKEFPPDGYYEQYTIRVEQHLLEDAVNEIDEFEDDSASYHGGGTSKSRTKRKRKAKKSDKNTQRKIVVEERKIDGVDLKLYEISEYWREYFEQQTSQQPQTPALIPVQRVVASHDQSSTQKRPPRNPHYVQSNSTFPVQRQIVNQRMPLEPKIEPLYSGNQNRAYHPPLPRVAPTTTTPIVIHDNRLGAVPAQGIRYKVFYHAPTNH